MLTSDWRDVVDVDVVDVVDVDVVDVVNVDDVVDVDVVDVVYVAVVDVVVDWKKLLIIFSLLEATWETMKKATWQK